MERTIKDRKANFMLVKKKQLTAADTNLSRLSTHLRSRSLLMFVPSVQGNPIAK